MQSKCWDFTPSGFMQTKRVEITLCLLGIALIQIICFKFILRYPYLESPYQRNLNLANNLALTPPPPKKKSPHDLQDSPIFQFKQFDFIKAFIR